MAYLVDPGTMLVAAIIFTILFTIIHLLDLGFQAAYLEIAHLIKTGKTQHIGIIPFSFGVLILLGIICYVPFQNPFYLWMAFSVSLAHKLLLNPSDEKTSRLHRKLKFYLGYLTAVAFLPIPLFTLQYPNQATTLEITSWLSIFILSLIYIGADLVKEIMKKDI